MVVRSKIFLSPAGGLKMNSLIESAASTTPPPPKKKKIYIYIYIMKTRKHGPHSIGATEISDDPRNHTS